MSHPDATTLALAALGEEIAAADAAHLASCPSCRDEVAELAELVAIGREAPSDLPELPDRVWTGIQEELGLTTAIPAVSPIVRGGERTSDGASGTWASAPPARPEALGGTVVPLPRRSGWGRLATVASVAAMVGALVGGTIVWSAVSRATPEPGAQLVVARATLDPLSDKVAEPGEAKVLDSPDGLVVRVDARALPSLDGFYEVWLLDSDATKLVALGALPSGSVGTFTVPPGVSIDDFPVVDISLEAYDGDPGHSKNSLMRGVLI